MLWAGRSKIWDPFRTEVKVFFFVTASRPTLEPIQTHVECALWAPPWRTRQPDELTTHIHLVPNSCIGVGLCSTITLHDMALKKHRNNFISLLSTLLSLRKSNDWKLRREKERENHILLRTAHDPS
jgi:hypothetical protein